MHKLFIGGFPLETSELELAGLIAPHGDISTIKIVRDRKTRLCKGYAFVEMQTVEGAHDIITALHDVQMNGRSLTVKLTEEEAPLVAAPRPHAGGSRMTVDEAYGSIRPRRPRRAV